MDLTQVVLGARALKHASADSSLPAITSTVTWPGSGINEQQTVTITGTPTGGTFVLGFGNEITDALDYDATAAEVQTALRALSAIGNTGVTVAGSAGGPYTVTFAGTLAHQNVALLAANGSGLTGGSDPDVTIVEAVLGVPTWADFPILQKNGVTVAFAEDAKDVEAFMQKWRLGDNIIKEGVDTIKVVSQESGVDALLLGFSTAEITSGDGVATPQAITFGNKATPTYKAVAVETKLGVWYFPNARAVNKKDIAVSDESETGVEITFKVFQSASLGFCARFIKFLPAA